MAKLKRPLFLSILSVAAILCCGFLAMAQVNDQNLGTLSSKESPQQLTEIQQKNMYAQQKYFASAVKLAQEGAERFSHGGECNVSCPAGCCTSGEGLVYEGGVFMLMNSLATTQAQTHTMSAMQACLTFNRISATKKNCSVEIKNMEYTKPSSSSWYDDRGNCRSNAPPECQLMKLFPGSTIFADKSVSCKKNLLRPCQNDFFSTYKNNDDGSITVNTGSRKVVLSLQTLQSVQSLKAAGVPSDLAASLLNRYREIKNSYDSDFSKVQLNPLAAYQSENSSANLSGASLAGENSTFRQQLPGGERLVAQSQEDGLVKNFRGEPINTSNMDIFKVVASRYKKTADSLLP